MKRREFVVRIGGAALTWPLAVGAQQLDQGRRLAVLLGGAESDLYGQLEFAAFKEKLTTLGWIEGNNLRIDVRWAAGDAARGAQFAKELVERKPEVILSSNTPTTAAFQRETHRIPIVMVSVTDPIGSGFVKSLAHPRGNITGFINLESSVAQKHLQLLKDISPDLKRVAAIFNPKTAPYAYYLPALKAAAQKLRVQLIEAPVSSESDIEKVIGELGIGKESGVFVMPDAFLSVHRKVVIGLTAQRRIPAIYPRRQFVVDGGLIGYGVDFLDLHRRAASYVDRILRGVKPQDLPVEYPRKFELAVNMRTAKALGITIPDSILAQAELMIE
jgi:putative ABC transport system substrate-binding protein